MGNENKKLQIIDLQGLLMRKMDSLRTSQQEILNKHRNSNTLSVFSFLLSVIYENKFFDIFENKKTHNLSCEFPFAEKEGFEPPDL